MAFKHHKMFIQNGQYLARGRVISLAAGKLNHRDCPGLQVSRQLGYQGPTNQTAIFLKSWLVGPRVPRWCVAAGSSSGFRDARPEISRRAKDEASTRQWDQGVSHGRCLWSPRKMRWRKDCQPVEPSARPGGRSSGHALLSARFVPS